jgi:glycosyltransferase involved in cell wall biosynthesis
MNRRLVDLARGAAVHGADLLASANGDLRATLLLNEYRDRRQHYATRAREMGLHYSDALVASRTKERLAARGVSVAARKPGDVHTLAFFPLVSWHSQLLRPLQTLGHLSHFDGLSAGLDYAALFRREPAMIAVRQRACDEFLRYATEVSRRRKVDWVFAYATAMELLADTVDQVREITGAPVVGMCLDDKQSWVAKEFGGQYGGQLPLAPRLDLAWTSARIACLWYMVEGGNPIYLPEGCDTEVLSPAPGPQDVDACFVGQAYGYRRAFIRKLRQLGLSVRTAGTGWPGGSITADDVIRLYRRSKIILGLGGIGWCAELKNVKGRDFDSPALGTAVYLTSFNPELAEHFDIGKEICCFSSPDECVEVAQELLANESRRQNIAQQGRVRCLRAHTWVMRFERVLEVLGVLVR